MNPPADKTTSHSTHNTQNTARTAVGVLFSGGKDSFLALHRAVEFHTVSCLITVIPENRDSYMFHTPAVEHTRAQAEALGLPHVVVRTRGEKEKELLDLKRAIEIAIDRYGIRGVVSGAIDSIYQATRIQRICHELGVFSYNPLWQMEQAEVLREVVRLGIKPMIVGVFGYPLTPDFLGRVIDEEIVKKLVYLQEKMGFNPAGEGGELETFVVYDPMFRKKLVAREKGRVVEGSSGYLLLEVRVERGEKEGGGGRV